MSLYFEYTKIIQIIPFELIAQRVFLFYTDIGDKNVRICECESLQEAAR